MRHRPRRGLRRVHGDPPQWPRPALSPRGPRDRRAALRCTGHQRGTTTFIDNSHTHEVASIRMPPSRRCSAPVSVPSTSPAPLRPVTTTTNFPRISSGCATSTSRTSRTHLQPLLGLQRRDVEGHRRQRRRGEPRPAVGLAVRTRRLRSGAAGEPRRNPGGHQLRQRLSYGHDLFTEMRTLLRVQRGLSFAAEYAGDADVPRRYRVEDVLRAATVGRSTPAARTRSERSRSARGRIWC